MRKLLSVLLVSSAVLVTGHAMAQDTGAQNDDPVASAPDRERGGRRDPVDLEKFSRLESLKAADKDGDGSLSREELEALALERIVKRMADRMERRLDIDGDGTVTIAEIEKQRGKEFAALDRNEDGVLDRSELRAGKRHGGPDGGRHGGHGPRR